MEQIITENKRLREKVKTLEAQLDKLKRKLFYFISNIISCLSSLQFINVLLKTFSSVSIPIMLYL
jgi:hypothetical protein